ncbi:hypothetical protein [Pontibacter fetidus]|uniref:Uncharacterized protein n=1 Tax=Pontibacter fetidus TaxID=2700082 RepID=A0A6B2H4C0_9BACT|nr:hypothetical protein [Pontibacter fetidus]NDK56968.1 hypothetical protein [Pontibacter fetidus]
MKIRYVLTLLGYLTLLAGFPSCENSLKSEDDFFSEGVIAVSVNNEFKVAPKAKLIEIARKSVSEMYMGTEVHKIEVIEAQVAQNGMYRYLFASAVKDGTKLSVAIELVAHKPEANTEKASIFSFASTRDQVSYLYMPGEKHSCAGNNCSSCSFEKDREGKIIGCTCSSTGSMMGGSSYCNHTIST